MSVKPQRVYLSAIGLTAPGLNGWQNSLPVLKGDIGWKYTELERYKPAMLPPNERRRATDLVRIAFKACEDALDNMKNTNEDKIQMATVFASSGGDYQVIDQLCRALSRPEREVSPTAFHNSVHNAPAGYWGISTGCQLPSTAISAYDATFATGFLEAGMMLYEGYDVVLLCAYDSKPPFPLSKKRLIDLPFSVAFILMNSPDILQPIAILDLQVEQEALESRVSICELDIMRLQNPAARSLPLLECIAKHEKADLTFILSGKQKLRMQVNFDV